MKIKTRGRAVDGLIPLLAQSQHRGIISSMTKIWQFTKNKQHRANHQHRAYVKSVHILTIFNIHCSVLLRSTFLRFVADWEEGEREGGAGGGTAVTWGGVPAAAARAGAAQGGARGATRATQGADTWQGDAGEGGAGAHEGQTQPGGEDPLSRAAHQVQLTHSLSHMEETGIVEEVWSLPRLSCLNSTYNCMYFIWHTDTLHSWTTKSL